MKFGLLVSALATSLLSTGVAAAQAATGVILNGPFPDELNGSNFTYPYPVKVFKFSVQQQELQMAFMDIKPSCKPNGKTAVLLHGKNFCGPTWGGQIKALTGAGWRVIAPDQIGFCKSTKPANFQFSLSQLAWNTRGLLNTLSIGNVTVIGHSLGGMLSTRFSLQYADSVDRLVLVDPIGLEDYVQKGVPYISIDDNIKQEASSTFASIKGYEQQFYYVGQWQPSYDVWVNMLVNIYNGPQRNNYIKNQGQIVDLVLTQPIAPFFKDLKPKTLLIVGDKDATAIGQWAPPAVLATLGHFNVLGPQVAAQIPRCTLHQFPTLGHAPQISDPTAFNKVLLDWLKTH
ncbi:2-hydroxy-6-oxo-6-phenylhexa-2,4-dienoate hydrolase-like protein [Cladobotryum mycophilum]|uniref:2-hydroxy-6-oxo-6-phenylhexa-2,4-dienoate hydrolase-like protein n=1 Tax=Cladobotryum mycophilum TaxID=491253 RepID=A0ABR0SF84_9HYPO